jgi:large subunit ribosomal protein L12
MEYIYAALMLHSLSKEINEANVKKIIEAAGSTPDDAKVKALIASLSGVDIEKAIKEAAVAPVAAQAEGEKAAPKEEKKEDTEKEEKKKADAAVGLASLFGG